MVAVAGMILGLVGLKRRRAQEDNGDDKEGDEEGQQPAAIHGDAPVGNNHDGGGNGEWDGHPMEGVAVATWDDGGACGLGGSGDRGVASDAAAAMDEGRAAEPPPARRPGRAAQEALLEMIRLGPAATMPIPTVTGNNVHTDSGSLQEGNPASALSQGIHCKTATMADMAAAPSMASMTLHPGSDGSGLTSRPGSIISTVGNASELSLQRGSWASLLRLEQSMTQRQPSAAEDGSSAAAEGEALPTNGGSNGSLVLHVSDPLQLPLAQSAVSEGGTTAFSIGGPPTQPPQTDKSPMLANNNPLFAAIAQTEAVEAGTIAGGGATLLRPPSFDEAHRPPSEPFPPSELIPPKPPSSILLSGISPRPLGPSRTPPLPGPQAPASDLPQHFVACAAAAAAAAAAVAAVASDQPRHAPACAAMAAAATPLALDTVSLGSPLAWPQRLGGVNGGGGSEGSRGVANDVAAAPAGRQLTSDEQRALQELLASYVESDDIAAPASRVVTTVVNSATPITSVPDRVVAAAAAGTNASRIPGRAAGEAGAFYTSENAPAL